MANKTPYELRFELLAIAKDTLETEYHTKIEMFRWEVEMNKRVISASEIDNIKFPSKEEIIKLAEDYKVFIEQK